MQDALSKTSDLSFRDRACVVALCAVLYVGHLALGGGNNFTSLSLTCLYGLTLTGLAPLWSRRGRETLRSLAAPALLFGLTLCVGVLSLTPFQLDPAHSVWALVGRRSTPSVDHSRTFLELIKLLGLACIFLAGVMLGQSRRRSRFFLSALSLFAAAYGLWSFLSFVIAPNTIMGVGEKVLFRDRLTASFLSPNTAGTFFGMALVLAVGLLIERLMRARSRSAGRSALAATLTAGAGSTVIVLITATALLLTGSRSAVLCTALALALLLIAEAAFRRWSAIFFFSVLLPTGAIAAFGSILLSGSLFLTRIAVVSHETLSRTLIYGPHWRLIAAFPLQGFGLGSFEEMHHSQLTASQIPYVWDVRAMHNVYMQWLEGAGWLGALPMFGCCLVLLVLITRRGVAYDPTAHVHRVILAASIVVILHGLTDFALENPSLANFWACLLGVGAGAKRPQRHNRRIPEVEGVSRPD